ncbi:hypothetical protein [Acinetobacter portensis]|uniref:hypothetical protein n=1 Tax=Acinetobacter portensis TaxID=1839785 RepID=UPI0013CFD43A|nr:hypothetical protein [Acinetobacter portensis]
MHLPILQALIRNEIPPQAINIQHLIEMAEKYQNPQSSEYKLVELALNIVLGRYLEKVNKLL